MFHFWVNCRIDFIRKKIETKSEENTKGLCFPMSRRSGRSNEMPLSSLLSLRINQVENNYDCSKNPAVV